MYFVFAREFEGEISEWLGRFVYVSDVANTSTYMLGFAMHLLFALEGNFTERITDIFIHRRKTHRLELLVNTIILTLEKLQIPYLFPISFCT